MSLAPFNKKNRLLGKACLADKSGFPTWKMAELMVLRDEYGYPPFPEPSDEASEICSYYLTQLPISCTRGYKLSKPLGSGAGGSVYIMCTEGEECVYAGKYIILRDEKAKAKFLNEVALMRESAEADIGLPLVDSWTCVVPFYDAFKSKFAPSEVGVVVMPLATMTAADIEINAAFIPAFRYLLDGLRENGIMHRDLKLENIVVHEGQLRLIDFGLAWKKDTPDLNAGEDNFLLDPVPSRWEPDFDAKCLQRSMRNAGVQDDVSMALLI